VEGALAARVLLDHHRDQGTHRRQGRTSSSQQWLIEARPRLTCAGRCRPAIRPRISALASSLSPRIEEGGANDRDVLAYDLAGRAGKGGGIRPTLGRVGGMEPPTGPRGACAAPARC